MSPIYAPLLQTGIGFVIGFLTCIALLVRKIRELRKELLGEGGMSDVDKIFAKWTARASKDTLEGKELSAKWYAEQVEKEIKEIIDNKEE